MRETRSASIELHPRGCLIVRPRRGFVQTLEHARENVDTCVEMSNGKKRLPVLIDLTSAEPLPAEVRHYYADEGLVENFTAVGLLVEASPLGRMMGNVFFRMMDTIHHGSARTSTRLFGDEKSALDWLTAERR